MIWLDQLVDAIISGAENGYIDYQQTLNYVKNSQYLVIKTLFLRHSCWEETFIEKDMSELIKLSYSSRIQDHY